MARQGSCSQKKPTFFEIRYEFVNDFLQGSIVAYVQQRVALMQERVADRAVCVLFEIFDDALATN
jgi:hypothetical protein